MKYNLYSKNQLDAKITGKFSNFDTTSVPNYVFSFGGDGTFLHCVREYEQIQDKVTFVGINMGHLGFYTEFSVDEIESVINDIEDGNYEYNSYSQIEVCVDSKDETHKVLALNEVAITNPVQTIIIDVYLNDIYFETFRGTGLLICTTAGSTAYNKSLGGSVVDPSIDVIQLTEIAPINNRIYKTINSSLILSKDTKIDLVVKNDYNTFVCIDGIGHSSNEINRITIKQSPKKINCIVKKRPRFENIRHTFLK